MHHRGLLWLDPRIHESLCEANGICNRRPLRPCAGDAGSGMEGSGPFPDGIEPRAGQACARRANVPLPQPALGGRLPPLDFALLVPILCWMDLLASLLHFAFPEPCISCGGGANLDCWPLCEDCRLPRLAPKELDPGLLVSRVWSMAPYSGSMGALVRRAKYRPDAFLMRRLATLMAVAIPALPAVDAVVHVPTAPARLIGERLRPGGSAGRSRLCEAPNPA